ncbi:response regulator [Magnetospirillum gryphiswaldense]|uniref:CheY-like receiver n=2 Tax=Magnetospirillum gryphiswaldense TaxID=55518 RepID=A4U2G8_9PROT|nr:response regulator [Magnetospirillum gryphiswaldense]AVM74132.1 Chemotaxis protein CheY [Magnetospirillum gryphiswaldense MSR-1]AVM78035.1 Chemotaxis protein CheY [Magnetospirillum gryphiswaldense]CAM77075.1 CheY-like receiver [Magnetospirillum gryphiswaldense MSR-1]CDK97939.1 putative probable chemotaxis protein CheY [Magnetospirillum gryphiswaldense MSR-1 v2]
MAGAVDFASLKILVIDDQEFVRTIVKKMLQQLGTGTVLEAQDGNSGMESVIRDKPDLVICDIQMRPMDGFGFVRQLRGAEGVADTPVIMLTAHTDSSTISRAKELDIGAFLAKPVLPPALKEKITQVMGG